MNIKKDTWISRHQLISFFFLTYAINITATYGSGYTPWAPEFIIWFLQIFSPTISAVIISGLIGGTSEVKRLLSGFARWRVGIFWYAAAFALAWIPLLASLIYKALGNSTPGIDPGMTPLLLLYNLMFTFFSGPFAEEAGWRGFALPRLQLKYNALVSSLILGAVWTCWHLPFYSNSGGSVKAGIPFPIYFVMVTSLSIFFTWIYNNTNGSLPLCIIAHFCFNFSSAFIAGFLGLLPQMFFYITCGGSLGLLLIFIIFYYGPKRLSKTTAL